MNGPAPISASRWLGWSPLLAAASRGLRGHARDQRVAAAFTVAVGAVNLTSLFGSALAFHWIDPVSMGVWHTLMLLSSYLAIARLGVINGMGRELPFALGRGDLENARRTAATALAFNTAGSALVGLTFVLLMGVFWSAGPAWRLALPAVALVTVNGFYFSYLQATFRSDSDFSRLTRVNRVQAGIALLLPVMVYAFGFTGLCGHAVLQSLLVTAYAHAVRPLRVRPHFERARAWQLLATGMPLFVASYLQTLAVGFDRVILLHRAGVEAVGYYAPALAVLSAMGIVPGAVTMYVYPRMSYALGQGKTGAEVRGLALKAAGLSLAATLPVAIAGWLAAPPAIVHFFPQYVASIPAVRWSVVAGLLGSVSPAAAALGSLKAWTSLSVYVGFLLVVRWAGPWLLSGVYGPLEGVARGNAIATALAAALCLVLVVRATRARPSGAAA